MLPKQVVQVPPSLPVRRGFPHHDSIPVIFEKFQTQILAWWGNSHQLKNVDFFIDSKVLITKLSFKDTFLMKSTLGDNIFF